MRRFVIAASVGALLGAACGGGGGGGSGPTASVALWNGQYHAFAVVGPGSGLRTFDVSAAWGVSSFDGAGRLDEDFSQNADGSIRGPLFPIDGDTYEVDADRAVRVAHGLTQFARGGISADGSLALLSTLTSGDGPGIFLHGRREGTFASSPLAGTWRMVGFSHAYAIPRRASVFGSVTFDATGGLSMTTRVNSEGALFGPAVTAIEYLVFADGRMILAFATGERFDGALLRGGDVIALAGELDSGGDPTFLVLVREVAAPTVAGLAGAWFVSSFGFDVGTTEYFGLGGRATADSTGTLSFAVTRNAEGTVAALPPVGGSWEVDGAGLVTLTLSGGDKFEGRVAPGGDFVAVSGGITAPSNPAIFLFLR